MVEVRRHLHAHPEVSGDERETSLYLYQLLGDEGFGVRLGHEGRGVIADSRFEGVPSRGVVALRADIDALRIHDGKDVAYRSRCDGIMHACGHDAHTALVFGALVSLHELAMAGQLPWPINLRGIFQPAEETCEGARQMVELGAMDHVEAILASHVDPNYPVGRIGLRSGLLTANCDEMHIHIRGRGGHAARPHETSDPIAAAALLINALYLYIPRVTDSREAVVITIGQVDGGEHANVIPENVYLRGTIRTLEQAIRRQTMDHVCRLAYGIGETTDTKIHVTFGLGTHSIDNNKRLVELLAEAGREVLGPAGVEEIARPSMGSEDFAFYLEEAPGAMFRLGCTSDKAGGASLHTPMFDVDEEAIRHGARILARAAVRWFGQEPEVADAVHQESPRAQHGLDQGAMAP